MRVPTLPAMAIRECRIGAINFFIKGIVAYHVEESGMCIFIPQETFQSYDIFIPLSFATQDLKDAYGEHTKCLCCLINDMTWTTWDEEDFPFINNLTLQKILCQLEEEVAH